MSAGKDAERVLDLVIKGELAGATLGGDARIMSTLGEVIMGRFGWDHNRAFRAILECLNRGWIASQPPTRALALGDGLLSGGEARALALKIGSTVNMLLRLHADDAVASPPFRTWRQMAEDLSQVMERLNAYAKDHGS